MEWYHVLGMVLGNLAIILPLWLWSRSENRADMRDFQGQITSDRREFLAIINEIKLENKDFHYRLLEIEKNRKI